MIVQVDNAQHAMVLKQQVLDHGLLMGQDFTWRYVPNQYDGWDAETSTIPHVVFEFRDPGMETFFKLRWQ